MDHVFAVRVSRGSPFLAWVVIPGRPTGISTRPRYRTDCLVHVCSTPYYVVPIQLPPGVGPGFIDTPSVYVSEGPQMWSKRTLDPLSVVYKMFDWTSTSSLLPLI